MDRKPLTIVVGSSLLVVLLVIVAAVTGLYVLQSNASNARTSLLNQVTELTRLNRDLKEENDRLTSDNKKLKTRVDQLKSTAESTQSAGGQESSGAKAEQTEVEKLVTKSVGNQISGDFKVEDIKVKDGWASAVAVPSDPGMEGAFYLLRKEDGKWKIIDFGTGLDRTDYPSSPADIWP